MNQLPIKKVWSIWPLSEPQSSSHQLPVDVRRTIDPSYKATRQTLAERRGADQRRHLERTDPPLAWILSGPAWPCCPDLAPD